MRVTFNSKERVNCLIWYDMTSKVVRSHWGTFGTSSNLIKI